MMQKLTCISRYKAIHGVDGVRLCERVGREGGQFELSSGKLWLFNSKLRQTRPQFAQISCQFFDQTASAARLFYALLHIRYKRPFAIDPVYLEDSYNRKN